MNFSSEVQQASMTLRRIIQPIVIEDHHIQFEVERDFEEMIGGLQMVESIYPSSIVMLCKRQHPNMPYVSANVTNILGYSVEQFRSLSMEAYFSLIHHEDIKPVTKCFDYMKSVVAENSSILLPTKFRFVFYYRMRTLTGNFITIRDEKLIIKNQMNRHVGITLLSNVSKDNLYFTVKVELNKYLDNHLVKVHEFVPRAIGNMFTNRELEVIKLIDQGLSNIDIAERLNISIHTVKNHRKNVSKKANVRNSLELIRFARNENII